MLKLEKESIFNNINESEKRFNNINLELNILINELEEIKFIENIKDEKEQTIKFIQHVFKEPDEKEKFINNMKNTMNEEQYEKFKITFDNFLNLDENNIFTKEKDLK
jgi:hypothetical protein